MKEEFLHFIWHTRQFDQSDLVTDDGRRVTVIQNGRHNVDRGPDFSEAAIRLNNTLWAGNVEIHINSAQWYEHGHHHDPKYNSVILHVCWKVRGKIVREDGEAVPQIELHDRVESELLDRYEDLNYAFATIPCERLVANVQERIVTHCLDRMLIERMSTKAAELRRQLDHLKGDWSALYWWQLCRSFGGKINAPGFEHLARTIDHKLVLRHRKNPLRIEALLFGCSGLLDVMGRSPYERQLRYEFDLLKRMYDLSEMDPSIWNFLHLRPGNFPTIRIAQLAAFLKDRSDLDPVLFVTDNMQGMLSKFKVRASPFWDDHYHFNKKSTRTKVKRVGGSMAHSILLNWLFNLLYTRAEVHNSESMKERILSWMQDLKFEENRVTARFNAFPMSSRSMADSQALLTLYNNYCNLKRCTRCMIGGHIICHETKSYKYLETPD